MKDAKVSHNANRVEITVSVKAISKRAQRVAYQKLRAKIALERFFGRN